MLLPAAQSHTDNEGKNAVALNRVRKSFGNNSVLLDISFHVKEREIFGVIGPSGGGKSTLLRCINLLERIDQGSIEYFDRFRVTSTRENEYSVRENNRDLNFKRNWSSQIRQRVGLVFQGFNLWEEKSVLANLTLAPRVVLKQPKKLVEGKAEELCLQFGIADKLKLAVWRLSGGQRQRVAILRALMMDPTLLLLDEVTSALDPNLSYEVMQTIVNLKERGITLILVTHHIEFASSICDRVMFLSHGQIAQIDTVSSIRNHPATDEIRQFISILEHTR
jgi:ABC-type polar amino acid transport system ATPase subunit